MKTNEINERVAVNIELCWDEENQEFDWDEYELLCSYADYWDCEE